MNGISAFRYSRQRERILEYLKGTKIHPNADMVYEKMREEFPSISLGTVYRNLHMLSEQGIILRLRSGSGPDRFDADLNSHSHFQCDNCGKIYDIEEHPDRTVPKSRHLIKSHHTTYGGTCMNCIEEKSKQ
jgi:Fur family peroxide stress response transcriptional regulator